MRRHLLETGRAWPAPLGRGWIAAHALSLVFVAVVVIIAARGQWFYYDEWDFLAPGAEWSLLASHGGHFSLWPQLVTTLLKGVFGLSTYWPYLLPVIAVHLVIVHLLWRTMMRVGSNAILAIAVSTVFGVLANGSENTLWAFQLGFITPLALGFGALLLAARPTLSRRAAVGIAVLLVVSVGFSGTALPMVFVTGLLLLIRHGLRTALVCVSVAVVLYAAWFVTFGRTPQYSDRFRADGPWEVFIGIPQFVLHGFVDSVGDMLPLAALSPVLLVLLAVWIGADVRKRRVTDWTITHVLLVALVLFAVLTAFSRVGLGNDGASVGRYAYVYGLLLAPAVGVAATWLTRGSVKVLAMLSVVLLVLGVYNAAGLVVAGQTQADQERTVERAMSAAVASGGCDQPELAERRPSPLIAPTLTMADVCTYVARGQFSPGAYSPSDALDVRVNLFLSARSVERDAPEVDECEPADVGGVFPVDPERDLVYVPGGAELRVNADDDGAFTQYAAVQAPAGVSEIIGLEGEDLDLRLGPADSGLCVISR